MSTSGFVLHLGGLVRVEEGHLNLGSASVISNGVNLGKLSTVIAGINNKIDLITHNADPAAIDSLSEILNRAQNINELAMGTPSLIPHSAIVYADAKQPLVKSLEAKAHEANPFFSSYDGWLFQNKAQGEKINWYMPVVSNMKVKDIRRLYMNLLLLKDTTNGNLPWITLYTKKKSDPTDKGGWYSSRINYLSPNALTAGHYRMEVALKPDSPVLHTDKIHQTALLIEGANTLKSDSFSEDDDIHLIAISTNSGSSPETAQFIVSSFLAQTPQGIKQSVFTNSAVEESYLRNKVDQLFQYFFKKSVIDGSFTPTSPTEGPK